MEQEKQGLLNTLVTFGALVNGMIPRTPNLGEKYGAIYYYGAPDYDSDKYMIMMLNYYAVQYATVTAELLNRLAKDIFIQEGTVSNISILAGNSYFMALSMLDQIYVRDLLSQWNRYDSGQGAYLQDYPGLLSILSSLNRFVMLGYYSEWYGYGTSRFKEPNQRVLEFQPNSWKQVGYPGRSFSYINYIKEYYQAEESVVKQGG